MVFLHINSSVTKAFPEMFSSFNLVLIFLTLTSAKKDDRVFRFVSVTCQTHDESSFTVPCCNISTNGTADLTFVFLEPANEIYVSKTWSLDCPNISRRKYIFRSSSTPLRRLESPIVTSSRRPFWIYAVSWTGLRRTCCSKVWSTKSSLKSKFSTDAHTCRELLP